MGRPAEPYLVPVMGLMLDRHADKSPAVRTAAEAAANALTDVLNPPSASLVLQVRECLQLLAFLLMGQRCKCCTHQDTKSNVQFVLSLS